MKVLYLDFLCPRGHLNLDINQIRRLSNFSEVLVVSQKGRYKNLPKNVVNIEKENIEIRDGKIRNRLYALKNMIISAFESKKNDCNVILVSSFETIIFAIGRFFLKKEAKIFIVHHNNTDELSNKVKAFFFRTYMNKVKHIVFSDFIKDYLVNTFTISSEDIFVIPHHMNILNLELNDSLNDEKIYKCVGLSNSNDEKIISEIIKREKNDKILKKMKIKIILKSKKFDFDDGYLKVVRGFLTKDVYDDYIKNSESNYLPFPNSFKYRMSGTLIEALANNQIVYGSDIPVMRYYSKRYKNICKVIKSADDFFQALTIEKCIADCSFDFDKFKNDHSEKKIEDAFEKAFESAFI